jgi:hypothetical protein
MNKRTLPFFCLVCLWLLHVAAISNGKQLFQKEIIGAYHSLKGDSEEVILFTDGYYTLTSYADKGRKFLFTEGGPFKKEGATLVIQSEFNTRFPETVGTTRIIALEHTADKLVTNINGVQQYWSLIDNGIAPLAGAWHITKRMEEGNLKSIHQTGTRKTIKLLTGSRFQWIAIDPAVKGFYGTGGGIYTFNKGKYTEQIGFFSRDSSRVGAQLQFEGKLQEGEWHHKGKSSKGDDIYEIWSRTHKRN